MGIKRRIEQGIKKGNRRGFKNITLLIVGILLVGCQTQRSNHSNDFTESVQQRLPTFDYAQSQAFQSLFLQGQSQRAIQQLQSAADPASAVDQFILGNILFKLDENLSANLHDAAYQQLPNNWAVVLEQAMQKHRQGDCKSAMPLYRQLHVGKKLPEPYYALLAHCYIELGDYMDAVAAWRLTRFHHNHTGVDKGIYEIFGELHPMARFSSAFASLQDGDEAALAKAFELAFRWDLDWWNAKPNDEALRNVFLAAKSIWPAESRLGKELRFFERIYAINDAQVLRSEAESHGYLGKPLRLPEHPYLLKRFLVKAFQLDLLAEEDLEEWLTQRVRSRERNKTLAIEDLQLLAHVLVKTKQHETLAWVDELGWRQFNNVTFAKSYHIGRLIQTKGKLSSDDEHFRQLINDFPNEPYFRIQQYAAAKRDGKATIEQLAGIIRAEFHGLRSNRFRYARDLNSFFGRLARELSSEPSASDPSSK